MNIIKTFFAVLIPIIILDAVWLGTMSKLFYSKHLGFIMSANPVWIAAIIFYIIYTIGVVFFVVTPALAGSIPWYHVALRGALFGLVAYATYDLTNHATVANWPTIVTLVDLVWGSFLTAVASTVAYFILK